jgi:hypothetical protein
VQVATTLGAAAAAPSGSGPTSETIEISQSSPSQGSMTRVVERALRGAAIVIEALTACISSVILMENAPPTSRCAGKSNFAAAGNLGQ